MMGHRETRTWLAVIMAITALLSSPADAAPVSVRFSEGVTHGFLLVRSLAGETIGQGEMTQVVKEGDLVESRLVLRFKDGSLHDEHVAFSQQHVFTMIRYHLVQQGPSFPEQLDVSADRSTGTYKVRSKARKDAQEQVLTGKFALPNDTYNGMLVTMLLNLPKGASDTVHLLAFTPGPEAIKLDLLLMGERTVQVGEVSRKALHYAFKPDMGMIRKFIGKAVGKLPAHFHYDCWILADEVPSFVQFEGPLQLMGPIMRIELVSPRLSTKSEEEAIPSP
ncbi:MAG: hypothetical protein Q8N00_04150 [Nitrospirota bacterium]|nr:hypothetical protein [Nitrospirota bacterium]MDP3595808.1 hypothetical protein [Nitrospirota bacterium]